MSTQAPEHYPSDLSDRQWALLSELLPVPKSGPGKSGRPPSDLRAICNGIFYVVKTGCPWRYLPKIYGPFETVYGYFRRWRIDGVWVQILKVINGVERMRQGRDPEPSGACVDSQSIKNFFQGQEVGFDGNKKVKGRKRHVLTDTLGLMLAVVVTSANVSDQVGWRALIGGWFVKGASRIRKIWVDMAYRGKPLRRWVGSLKKTHKIVLEVSQREGKGGFAVEPKRWVVERTFAWLGNYRRNSKDYERLLANNKAMLQISTIRLVLRRLAP